MIKIGFDVDAKSLESARDAGRKLSANIAAQIKEAKDRNKSLTQQEDKERKKASDDLRNQMTSSAKEDMQRRKEREKAEKEASKEEYNRLLNLDAIYTQQHNDSEKRKKEASEKAHSELQKYIASLRSAAQIAGQLAAGLKKVAQFTGGAVALATGYTIKLANADAKILRLAESSGMAYNQLQELEYAAQKTGSSVGAMTGVMESLNVQLGQLAMGKGPVEAIAMLGINTSGENGRLKDTFEYLLRISDAVQRFDPQRQADLLSQLGFSQEQIPLIQKGRDGIMQLMTDAKKAGYANIEQAREELRLNKELTEARAKFNAALLPLRVEVIKQIIPILQYITGFLKENGEIIKHLFKPLLALAIFSTVASWVMGLLSKFLLLRAALLFLGGWGKAFTLIVSPVTLIASGIGRITAALWTAVPAVAAFVAPWLPLIAVVGALGALAYMAFRPDKMTREERDTIAGQVNKLQPTGQVPTGFGGSRLMPVNPTAIMQSINKPNNNTNTVSQTLSFNVYETQNPTKTAAEINRILRTETEFGLKAYDVGIV